MLRVIGIVLDILVLGAFTMDYLKSKEYLDELNRMKHEIWELDYKVSNMGNMVSRNMHG